MLIRPDYTASAKAVNDGDGGEGEYLCNIDFSFVNVIRMMLLDAKKINKYHKHIL